MRNKSEQKRAVETHGFDNIQSEFVLDYSKLRTLHMTCKNSRVVGSLDF